MIYRKYVKRGLDIVFSLLALIILSPVLLVTAILVRVKLGSPVLFRQPRPGKDENIFFLYKYRSMTNEVGSDGRLLPDQQRLTKFGKFLRASSLDELPELINILKGDMSIVGPRPLSIYYLPHYPKKYRQRHTVRPGLTGLAQVNGRNSVAWDERFTMDLEYVSNLSFLNDVEIIIQTGLKVLKHADVFVRGTAKVQDYGSYCVLKEEDNVGKRADGMTYSEIGSYFWLDGSEQEGETRELTWLPRITDSAFTFSGRNAIDLVVQDILRTSSIRTIYAPSYCCVSMLQSFIDRGLHISFYDVDFSEGQFTYALPDMQPNSVLLIMSYFGLNTQTAHDLIANVKKKKNITVIEDITHSLLCDKPYSEQSDYLIASLRKWFSVPAGGWAGKRNGSFVKKPDLDSNHAVADKVYAMQEKYKYLIGTISEKEAFLLANAKFDNDLIHVDKMLKMDDITYQAMIRTDIQDVIYRRRANVAVLLEKLSKVSADVITLPKVDLSQDVPLFLPIFLDAEIRDTLRSELIANAMYCPVHWPEVMGADKSVRERELSLICDQRYNEDDMRALADCVVRWCAQHQKS